MDSFSPRRILAATDFSELSTWALRHAVMWARRFGAELSVLHVQESPPIWGDPYVGSFNLAGLVEQIWEATSKRLEEHVAQEVPADVAVTRELLAGPPARTIEEFADGASVDLVVLGTHGREGLGRLLLGSVAERALRMSQAPTLIVREAPPHTEEPRLEHVLCPVNFTEVARAALDHARAVARAFGAQLTVVYSAETRKGPPGGGDVRQAEDELRAWLSASAGEPIQVQPMVRHGDAAEQVIALAREAAADVIVIGAQHRRFVDATVLGVTTVRVTRHAPCPVLVVPRSSDTRDQSEKDS
jgi:nucleotide-binding universal stress UspA family protein